MEGDDHDEQHQHEEAEQEQAEIGKTERPAPAILADCRAAHATTRSIDLRSMPGSRVAMAIIPSMKSKAPRFDHATTLWLPS